MTGEKTLKDVTRKPDDKNLSVITFYFEQKEENYVFFVSIIYRNLFEWMMLEFKSALCFSFQK